MPERVADEFVVYSRLVELGYTLSRQQRERRWLHILCTVHAEILKRYPIVDYAISRQEMAPWWAIKTVDELLEGLMHAAFPEIMRRDQRTIVAASPVSTS